MKYVLITGVSTGIGYGLCRDLISASYFVIGTVRLIEDQIRLQTEFPDNFKSIILDVSNIESVNAAYHETVQILGANRLYALINNAGIACPGPLIHISESDFQNQMDVNVTGIFRMTNQFVSLLKADDKTKSGRIVNLSSISGLLNTPFLGAYCISKHAVESLSDIYRRELDIYGIKVVIIEPGPIKSEIWGKSFKQLDHYSDTDYWPYLRSAHKLVDSIEKNALPTKVLSKVVIEALSRKRPKLRYIVDKKSIIIYLIHHFLPVRLMDYFTRRNLQKMRR